MVWILIVVVIFLGEYFLLFVGIEYLTFIYFVGKGKINFGLKVIFILFFNF